MSISFGAACLLLAALYFSGCDADGSMPESSLVTCQHSVCSFLTIPTFTGATYCAGSGADLSPAEYIRQLEDSITAKEMEAIDMVDAQIAR
jgi:hypothetical protein